LPFALATAAIAAGITTAVTPGDWPSRALAYATGGLVLYYGLGPGSGLPRGQLRRIFAATARTPGSRAVVLAGMTALAVAALAGAVSWPSLYWPFTTPGHFFHLGGVRISPLPGFLRRLGL
jgi:hypothetical protein